MNNIDEQDKTLESNEDNKYLQSDQSKFQLRHGKAILLTGLFLLVVLLGGLELLIVEGKLFKKSEGTKPITKELTYDTSLEEKNDSKISTSSTTTNVTVTESVKTNTQNSQTKELGTVEQTIIIKDPVENQAIISIDSGNTLIKDVEIILLHPDGRHIEIPPVDIQTQVKYDNEKKSYQDQLGTSTVFKLFPSDPLVLPLPGEWTIRVTAPIDTHLVFGVVQI